MCAGVAVLAVAAPAGADRPVPVDASAMPGFDGVGFADVGDGLLSASAGSGYHVASGVFDGATAHQRFSGSVAASYRPLAWWSAGLRFEGRFDHHLLDGVNESASVGTPSAVTRLASGALGAWRLGAQARLWFPGKSAPSVTPAAVSGDGLALASFTAPGGRRSVSANLGFRVDRSERTAPELERLSRADRLSLGINSSNAVLAGLAGRAELGAADLMLSWSWSVPVGAGAPRIRDNPMYVSAGARVPLFDSWQLTASAAVNLLGTYSGDLMEPSSDFAHRVGVSIALSRTWSPAAAPRPTLVTSKPPVEPVKEEPATAPKVPDPPPPEQPATSLRGRVVDPQGAAVAGADVYLAVGGREVSSVTGADGAFAFEEPGAGAGTLTVVAERFDDAVVELEAPLARAEQVEVRLVARSLDGELRGGVLGRRGRGVKATLVVEPGGVRITTGRDGKFRAALAPGSYDVTVVARGYAEQRKAVRIAPGGVVIMNIKLVAKP